MNIIQYNDNDHLHKPQTDGTAVYNVDPNRRSILTREEILTKFLPQLSEITKPLRDLTLNNVQFIWEEAHQAAFKRLKVTVTVTPAYASGALTPAETRYAQIEKSLSAIVFACDRFHAYVYGRDLVHIETDYKPLEPIFTKPLATAPKCLKRMFLSL